MLDRVLGEDIVAQSLQRVNESLSGSIFVQVIEVICSYPKPAMDFIVIQCYNSNLMPSVCLQVEASAIVAERHVSNTQLFCEMADTER